MKKILLSLSILSIILITSCGSDDSDPVEVGLSGTVTFNSQSYSIANGIFTPSVDDGAAVGAFFMSDGTLTATSSGASASGASIIISMTAVDVTSTSTLSSGSYATSTNTEEMFVFVTVTTADDSGQNTQQSFTGGTVTISGSENTYNVTFVDVPFGQDVTLSGTVTGTYSNE